MALDAGGGGGGRRNRPDRNRRPNRGGGGNRFADAGWTVVGDSDHAVGTINRPDGGSRFASGGRDLTRLTPYTMPVELPAAGQPSLSSWESQDKERKPLDVPDLFDEKDPYRQRRDAVTEPEQAGEPHGKRVVRRTYEMSWEDYNKLSDEQRAAVDFNTLLVQAREKDLNTDYHATDQEKATYDQAVRQMFGKDGGSDTFAPETLAVLRQIDFKATKGDDLDNFLGLKEAISAKELKGFSTEPSQSVLYRDGSAEARGLVGEQQLAANTAHMQKVMAKTNQLMASFRDSFARGRNEDLRFFGGQVNKVDATPGFGEAKRNEAGAPTNLDAFMQDAYSALANKDNQDQIDAVWSNINSTLRPREKQQFLEYADLRSRQALEGGLRLGDFGKHFNYRTPEEFRQLLGLGTGKAGE